MCQSQWIFTFTSIVKNEQSDKMALIKKKKIKKNLKLGN